jgi:hypothetical protein
MAITPNQALGTLRPEFREAFEQFDLESDRRGFVGNRILTPVEAQVQSGTFGVIQLESRLKVHKTLRASGAPYNQAGQTFQDQAFSTEDHGLSVPVDNRDSAIYRDYFDFEMEAAGLALDAVLRAYERRVAGIIFNPSTFTTTASSVAWTDTANSKPITDVNNAIRRIWDNTGLWAKTVTFNRHVKKLLRENAQIIENIKAVRETPQTEITDMDLAKAFDVEQVLVSDSAENVADENQDRDIQPMWSSKYVWLGITASGSFKQPCVGRTFHWSGDGSQMGGAFDSWDDPATRGRHIRVRMETDENIIYPVCGELIDIEGP